MTTPSTEGSFYSGAQLEADKMIAMPEDEFRTYVVQRFEAQGAEIAENTAVTRQVAADTAFMREAWKDGIATVRFFCRLAAAWRFMLRQVVVPVGLPVLFVYALVYYGNHKTMPDWIESAYKLIKVLL